MNAHSLDHLIREPAGEPEGALILNHGRGTSEHDLYPLGSFLDGFLAEREIDWATSSPGSAERERELSAKPARVRL